MELTHQLLECWGALHQNTHGRLKRRRHERRRHTLPGHVAEHEKEPLRGRDDIVHVAAQPARGLALRGDVEAR